MSLSRYFLPVFLVLLLFLFPGSAFAFSCRVAFSGVSSFGSFSTVFVGRIETQELEVIPEEQKNKITLMETHAHTVLVRRSFKGLKDGHLVRLVDSRRLSVGDEFLFYAYPGSPGSLRTPYCGPSPKKLSEASGDIALLQIISIPALSYVLSLPFVSEFILYWRAWALLIFLIAAVLVFFWFLFRSLKKFWRVVKVRE